MTSDSFESIESFDSFDMMCWCENSAESEADAYLAILFFSDPWKRIFYGPSYTEH